MIREYAEALIIALALALFIRTFIFQAYTIPSGSMLNTLQIGDYLLVNKFLYGVKNPFTGKYLIEGQDPERGDIIVFLYPEDNSLDYIKRIVGIPGDVIEMRDKQLYRNGEAVKEEYILPGHPGMLVPKRDIMPPITVPAGEYFVMGDNRDGSADSRFWGTVTRGDIHGKAWRIYWSWDGKNGSPRLGRLGSLVE